MLFLPSWIIGRSFAGHYEVPWTTEGHVYRDVYCKAAKICQLDSRYFKDRKDVKKKF